MSNNKNLITRWLDDVTGKAELEERLEVLQGEIVETNSKKDDLQSELADLRKDAANLQGAIQYLVEDAFWEGPLAITPDTLIGNLRELDSQLIDELVNRRQWDVLGGIGSAFYSDTELARDRAITDSRFLYVYSPLAQWIISVWTNYGLGDAVKVSLSDDPANEWFNEFWTAERNAEVLSDDQIQYLSTFTLQDGNTFLAFFASKSDGRVTVEEIPCDEIQEIVTHPERKSVKLFYKRVYEVRQGSETVYYPDWQAKQMGLLDDAALIAKVLPDKAIRADVRDVGDVVLNDIESKLGTDVCVLHIAHNRKVRKSHWGWPILTAGTPYIKSHKRFMEDRLTVAASKAMYTRRKQVTGGSRAIEAVRNTIASNLNRGAYSDTNPPAGAGSIELDNQAIKTTDLPMTTGASDAKNDHEMFSWMALLGGFLFPTTAGLDTSRWATALAMDKTLAMQWSRYQTFWASQFKRMVKIVMWFAAKYGGQTFPEDYTVLVSIDSLSLVDFPDVVTSLSSAVRDILLPFMQDGTIPQNTARAILRELWLIMLQALGLSASTEIASKEAFEVLTPEELAAMPEALRNFMGEIKQQIKNGDLSALAEYLSAVGNG